MRSDNGGEYISKNVEELLVNMKVKHELTSPYSPHQNGCAERQWRTLFEMARAMIEESKFDKTFWTYAVMTATHIRNRCYSRNLKCTPYEAVTGLRPDIGRLHLFGSICYTYIDTYKKKLDPRSKKGQFVGYDRNSMSYLVYHPETNVVSKHRVVKFTDKFSIDNNPTDYPCHDVTKDNPKGNTETPKSDEPIPLRRSERTPKKPDFLTYVTSIDDFQENIDYIYMCVPSSYQDAVNSDDSVKWKSAMDDEIRSLRENETYVVTEAPKDVKVVNGKWVFNIKGDPTGKSLYKARYVAKGCGQTYGVN